MAVNDVRPVPPLPTPKVPLIVESVVVATQVGLPFARERTKPSVVEETFAKEVAVLA